MKRDLLVVDRVGIVQFQEFVERLANWHGQIGEDMANELEWLRQHELVCDVPTVIPTELAGHEEIQEALAHAVNATEEHDARLAAIPKRVFPDGFEAAFDNLNRSQQAALRSRSFVCRIFASVHRLSGREAVSLLPVVTATPASRDDVLQVTLEQLPLPSDDVPWDEIIDFRNENFERLRALRLWAAEIPGQGLSATQAEEKLLHLIREYRESAKQLRASKQGFLSIIVPLATGVLAGEPLLGLTGAGVMAVATLRKEKAQLRLDEAQLPGREISYVVRVASRYSTR